jgi:serine/threonine-protein kinase
MSTASFTATSNPTTFLSPDGSVKIADFGISSQLNEPQVGDAVTGTIYYTAPEILMGQPAGRRERYLFDGHCFLRDPDRPDSFRWGTPEEVAIAQIKKHFPEPSRFNSAVPRSVDRIVVKACRKSSRMSAFSPRKRCMTRSSRR